MLSLSAKAHPKIRTVACKEVIALAHRKWTICDTAIYTTGCSLVWGRVYSFLTHVGPTMYCDQRMSKTSFVNI